MIVQLSTSLTKPKLIIMTPDDLVDRLREVKNVRWNQRVFKRTMEECGADMEPYVYPKQMIAYKLSKSYNRKTVRNAFRYINKWVLLEAMTDLPAKTFKEDQLCQILYDLAEFPLEQVLNRLSREVGPATLRID